MIISSFELPLFSDTYRGNVILYLNVQLFILCVCDINTKSLNLERPIIQNRQTKINMKHFTRAG